jgi:PKD repeat protein
VDFGDGTSAALSSSTGTITHTYPSAGLHQVKLTCNGAQGAATTVDTATVAVSAAAAAKARCLRIPRAHRGSHVGQAGHVGQSRLQRCRR